MGIEDSLSGAGIPYGLAAEILNSLKTGGATTAERISSFGVSGPAAIELARQINSRTGSVHLLTAIGIPPQAATLIKAAITGGAAPVIMLSRATDGSVGQLYTASAAGQWVTRTSAGVVTDISGQTGTTYTAQSGDVGKTIGIRNAAGVVTYAAGPVLAAPILIDAFDSMTVNGVTRATQNSASGAVGTIVSGSQVQGSGAYRVTGPSTALTPIGSDLTLTTALDPATTGVVAMFFNRESAASISSAQTFLFAGATSGSVNITDEANNLPGGRMIARDTSEFGSFATAAAGTGRVRAFVIPVSPFSAQAQFDAFTVNAKGIPTHVPWLDDGYVNQDEEILPRLEALGLKATLAPAIDNLGTGTGLNSFMTLARLKYWYDRGFDVACDLRGNDGYMSTDPQTAVTEALRVRQYLIDNGMPRAADFGCYPYGGAQADNSVITDAVASALVTAGFKICRGTQLGSDILTRFGIQQQMAVRKKYPSKGIGLSSTAADYKTHIDATILRGVTTMGHNHIRSDAGGDARFTPTAVNDAIYQNMATEQNANNLRVMTISEVWARDGGASIPV